MRSIVGRFLEHSRIYYFYNDGKEEVYLASADMMRRNLNRRVETLFPILQDDLKARVLDIFAKMWRDNVQARILHGTEWVHADRRGQSPFSSQEYFIAEAEEKVQAVKEAEAAESEIHKDAFEAMKPQENELEDTED